jgi:hypothetical protein
MQITLYSKPECQLCEEVKADLLAVQPEFGFALFERNIEEDPELFARFRYLIPVVDLEDHPLLYPPHTWQSLYNALRMAQQQEQERLAQAGGADRRQKGRR